jgi:hypothetical protein
MEIELTEDQWRKLLEALKWRKSSKDLTPEKLVRLEALIQQIQNSLPPVQ